MSFRYMRTLLFFDLPTLTLTNKRNYRSFIRLLKKNGFYMLQESVYCRMCIDQQTTDAVINKIKTGLPADGNVMVLTVTEKQFSSMQILLGDCQTDVITTNERFIEL